ncbi:MAG: O-antigen ligase family protein [Bacteroidia bacterium]
MLSDKLHQNQNLIVQAQKLIVSVMLILLMLRPQLLSITLFALIITNILTAFSAIKASHITKNKFMQMSLVLGLIFLLGMIGTKNLDRAIFDVVQKFSIPLIGFLIIYPFSGDKKSIQFIKNSFVFSGMATLLLCFILAYMKHAETGSLDPFYYTELSAFMHPGYFAMYLSFALAIMLDERKSFCLDYKSSIIFNLGAAFLITGIFFLASKSGYVTVIALGILFANKEIRNAKNPRLKRKIEILAVLFLLGISAALVLKSNRIKLMIYDYNHFETTNDENLSTAGKRVLIWESAGGVIHDHFWIGTGVGNDNAALKKEFENRGYKYLASRNLNAHNQFIQAFITLGISGFLFMLLYLFFPLWIGIKNKDFLLIAFSWIIILNAFTESILNRQAGVLFFTIWAFLLVIQKPKSPKLPAKQ